MSRGRVSFCLVVLVVVGAWGALRRAEAEAPAPGAIEGRDVLMLADGAVYVGTARSYDGKRIEFTTDKGEVRVDRAQARAILFGGAAVAPAGAGVLKPGTYAGVANGGGFTMAVSVEGGRLVATAFGTPLRDVLVKGDEMTFVRDCGGAGLQYYKGKIEGNRIKGTFTGAGGAPGQEFPWEMELQP